MIPIDSKKDFNAETLLQEHGKDISGLSEKLNRCYSQDRYKEFQKDVEEIAEKFLKSKIAWAVLIWLVTLIASMLVQKFLKFF